MHVHVYYICHKHDYIIGIHYVYIRVCTVHMYIHTSPLHLAHSCDSTYIQICTYAYTYICAYIPRLYIWHTAVIQHTYKYVPMYTCTFVHTYLASTFGTQL